MHTHAHREKKDEKFNNLFSCSAGSDSQGSAHAREVLIAELQC